MKFCPKVICMLIVLTVLVSCSDKREFDLKNGTWRATLKTETGAEIPFNFEVLDSADQKVMYIINGKERFRVDDIEQKSDSVIIKMPFFESEIRVKAGRKGLSGEWIKYLASTNTRMKFSARPDESWRFFKAKASPAINISGKWSASFTKTANQDTTVAIGEFAQNDGLVLGTFMTTTGDYRYLQGTISDKNLYLSSFDGGNAYLFTGKINNDSTISEGKFYSGLTGYSTWSASKDAKAMLPDAYSLTALKQGYDKIEFSFQNLEGKLVSLSDPRYRNKVVLIQFFGSWCPNCLDETNYLAPFYEKNKDKGLEIIALAYERSTDMERSRKNVQSLRDRLNVKYEMLLTGYTNDNAEVAKSLPMLKNFVAFPTLMIIDKSGRVRKIHTGFNGPGTGKHYAEFVDSFERSIVQLLNE